MVTLDNNDRPLYQLSGIAQDHQNITIILPKDRNLAVLGYPCLGGRSCKFVKEYPPRAHLLHARCWELIERLFGYEAEKNLKILLDIFFGKGGLVRMVSLTGAMIFYEKIFCGEINQ